MERNPTRSAEIQRKLLLFGAIGRNFVHPGSAACRVESSIAPGKFRTYARLISAFSIGERVRFRAPRPAGRHSAQSPLTRRDRAEFSPSRIRGRLPRLSPGNPEYLVGSMARRSAGSAARVRHPWGDSRPMGRSPEKEPLTLRAWRNSDHRGSVTS